MITIIKQGESIKEPKMFYKFECPHCHCVFECETEDFKLIEKTIDSTRFINCPCCLKELNTASDYCSVYSIF